MSYSCTRGIPLKVSLSLCFWGGFRVWTKVTTGQFSHDFSDWLVHLTLSGKIASYFILIIFFSGTVSVHWSDETNVMDQFSLFHLHITMKKIINKMRKRKVHKVDEESWWITLTPVSLMKTSILLLFMWRLLSLSTGDKILRGLFVMRSIKHPILIMSGTTRNTHCPQQMLNTGI